jgi:hypothetical protein
VTWFGWVLIGFWLVAAATTILQIGEERKPVSPKLALGTLIIISLEVAGALLVGTGHLR